MISPEEIKALLYTKTTLFEIIAQDDDNDYSESGWVAVYDPNTNKCGLGHYSHCSCYGTWENLKNGWDWEGTPRELAKLAKNKLDPDMPEREMSVEDFDYDHLITVYNEVLIWYKNRRKKND